MLRNIAQLGGRVVLGGYIAVHGAQKLFGAFDGPGLAKTGAGFAGLGLKPGKPMATLAGVSELAGGVLTATGIADPLGPIAIAGAMSVAVAVHRKSGPMAAKGGYELPLTNLALATTLALAAPAKLRLGPRLSRRLTAMVLVGAATFTAISLKQLLNARPAVPPAPEDSR
jgi:putative oxidoreductase